MSRFARWKEGRSRTGRRRASQLLFYTLYGKISLVLTALLFWAGVAWFALYARLWTEISDHTEQRVSIGVAPALANRIQPHLSGSSDYTRVLQEVSSFTTLNPRARAYLLSADGAIVAYLAQESPARSAELRIPIEPIEELLKSPFLEHGRIYGYDPIRPDDPVIFSAAPVMMGGRRGYLYVTLRSKNEEALWNYLLENSAALALAGVILLTSMFAIAIGLLAFRVLTRRFYQLTEVVRDYKHGRFEKRLDVTEGDEIDELAITVNQMADTIVSSIDELERRDRLRRELIANVSHDLRTPVAVIKGYIELLAERTGNLTPQDLEQTIGILASTTDALTRLLAELFDLAKLETNDEALTLEAFSLEPILEYLEDTYRHRCSEKGITFLLDVPDNLPAVLADGSQLHRALVNLVDNALSYTLAGGTVAVSVANNSDALRISVSDTGIGIAESEIAKVFDRFYRGKESNRYNPSSTGLGLAIVKRIIELHGSSIAVTSKEGEGTSFSFELKLAPAITHFHRDAVAEDALPHRV